ncbi:hypothetical protein Tco_1173085 [Tanacetum coccineum]
MFDEDVVDHIDKVLELLDLIKIPRVDSHQLRMKGFPLSLADDARQWTMSNSKGEMGEISKKLNRKFETMKEYEVDSQENLSKGRMKAKLKKLNIRKSKQLRKQRAKAYMGVYKLCKTHTGEDNVQASPNYKAKIKT